MGYPPNFRGHTWKRENRSNAHHAHQDTDAEHLVIARFTNSQYQQILSLLSKQDDSLINANANTSQLTGIKSYSLMSLNTDCWIIDSGASDHMCHDLTMFTNCRHNPNIRHMVTVPDERKLAIHTIGDIFLPNGIKLINVLHVPHFKYNLISVQKLTSQSAYTMIFNTSGCFIQDVLRKKQ